MELLIGLTHILKGELASLFIVHSQLGMLQGTLSILHLKGAEGGPISSLGQQRIFLKILIGFVQRLTGSIDIIVEETECCLIVSLAHMPSTTIINIDA